MTLTHPATYRVTRLVDVRSTRCARPTGRWITIRNSNCSWAPQEVLARLRVLGAESISAGQPGWAQLELAQAVVAARDDRFIVRRPSPGMTVGGGRVIEPNPPRRYRRFDEQILARLATLAEASPARSCCRLRPHSGWRPGARWSNAPGSHRSARPRRSWSCARGRHLVVLSGDPPRDPGGAGDCRRRAWRHFVRR